MTSGMISTFSRCWLWPLPFQWPKPPPRQAQRPTGLQNIPPVIPNPSSPQCDLTGASVALRACGWNPNHLRQNPIFALTPPRGLIGALTLLGASAKNLRSMSFLPFPAAPNQTTPRVRPGWLALGCVLTKMVVFPWNRHNLEGHFRLCRCNLLTYVRTCVRTYVRKYVRAYVRPYVHTYVRTYVHTYVRT